MARDAQFFLDNPGTEVSIDDIIESGLVSPEGDVADVLDSQPAKNPEDPQKIESEPLEENFPEEESRVMAADGKHEIPHSVLKGARERAKEFQEMYEEEKAANELLTAKMNRLMAAGEHEIPFDPSAGAKDIDPDYYSNEFGEEIGDLARSLKEQKEVSVRLTEELNAVRQLSSTMAEERRSEVVRMAEEAVTLVPDLVEWRQNKPDMFDKARDFDDMLKQDPRYSEVSLEDRFKKAVQMTKRYYGAVEAPQADDEEGLINAKMSEARNRRPGMVSLSQIKGGDREKTISDFEDMSQASIAELHKKFSSMDPKSLDKYLNSLGG